MSDILFKTDDYIFSYRVAGICINDGKVLLQKQTNDDGHAFPGGHVALGETNEQTLKREFNEEIGADVTVGALRWVAEIFFPWEISSAGAKKYKPCHQICLYYDVEIGSEDTPKDGKFVAHEHIDGRNFDIEFHWIPLNEVKDIAVYPTNATELLEKLDDGVQHFIYREG